jgi:hypothetical protein
VLAEEMLEQELQQLWFERMAMRKRRLWMLVEEKQILELLWALIEEMLEQDLRLLWVEEMQLGVEERFLQVEMEPLKTQSKRIS